MKYESLIERLKEKYSSNQRGYNCLDISESLALLALQAFPGHSVSTAQTKEVESGRAIIGVNHYVAIIRESDKRFVALDATRPTYEHGKEYWAFEAETEKELMNELSKHYGGSWNVDNKWLSDVPDWYDGI